MKKVVSILLVVLTLGTAAFAKKAKKAKAPPAPPFVFDFTKDFYPMLGYVVTHSRHFSKAQFQKVDIIKNEYIMVNVRTGLGFFSSPEALTLKVTVQKDGSLAYRCSDVLKEDRNAGPYNANDYLLAVKDGTGVAGEARNGDYEIEKDFNELLAIVSKDENAYNSVKNQFFTKTVSFLYLMTKGITEVRAEQFNKIIKGVHLSDVGALVSSIEKNNNEAFKEYQYHISAYVQYTMVSSVYFEYYTNDEDKVSLAAGDEIRITGVVESYDKRSPVLLDSAYFVKDDNAQE